MSAEKWPGMLQWSSTCTQGEELRERVAPDLLECTRGNSTVAVRHIGGDREVAGSLCDYVAHDGARRLQSVQASRASTRIRLLSQRCNPRLRESAGQVDGFVCILPSHFYFLSPISFSSFTFLIFFDTTFSW